MKHLYVLGAGVSAAVTRTKLLTANILEEIVVQQPPRSWHRGEKNAFQALADDLFRCSGGNGVSIEELLSVLDFAVSHDLRLGPDWSAGDLKTARLQLVDAIRFCVQRVVENGDVNLQPLVSLLKRDPTGDVGFVTFNWDTLLERAIQQLHHMNIEMGTLVDYSMDCNWSLSRHARYSDLVRRLVLKPHGSINWHYCKLCNQLFVDRELKPAQNGPKCLDCPPTTRLEPVIVAPSPPVSEALPVLNGIWYRVEEAIARCEQLTFVGYSMPREDIDVRVHLLRGLARRGKDKPLSVEIVVMHSPVTVEETAKRFQGCLGAFACGYLRAYENGMAGWLGGEVPRETICICGKVPATARGAESRHR